MILLDRVSKVYNRRGPALERISLHVDPKEFVIIVGPSGALVPLIGGSTWDAIA